MEFYFLIRYYGLVLVCVTNIIIFLKIKNILANNPLADLRDTANKDRQNRYCNE